jgi:adenosylcobinamide-phosphate synthase
MTILAYSTAALLTGFVLDMLFGDPHWFPHIVRWMAKLISMLEKVLRRALPKTDRSERLGGIFLVILVALLCTGIPFAALYLSYCFVPLLGYAVESLLCYQLLAAKSLKTESLKVYSSLCDDDVEAARWHVSMIVGRDTLGLDRNGITRAAVETVAENASDGFAAPLFFAALGGATLGCLYKAVNTMDSMVGFKNNKYLHFGRAAAKTDDVFNFAPSRICALLMIAGAYLLGFDSKNAWRVWRRDRRKHASPNSAQTESACAGALGIQLAGPAIYSGVLHDKPHIGDETRPIRDEDIVAANRLMYAASFLAVMLAILFRSVLLGAMYVGAK